MYIDVCEASKNEISLSLQKVCNSKTFGMLSVADFKLSDSLCNEIFILGESLDGTSSCYCGYQMLVQWDT
jgi:hypothetical protein